MNKFYLTLLLLACASSPAFAQDKVQPIIYNRITVTLIPRQEAKIISLPSPLPAPKALSKDDKANDEVKTLERPLESAQASPPTPRVPISFNVEMKSPDFLTQTDFITHISYGEHEGLLILIDPVDVATINATQMVGISDVLCINEDGIITKIAPNLNLATLNEPIHSGAPIRAFLYLRPGSVEQDRIVPGDRFENELFKTHPVIMQ